MPVKDYSKPENLQKILDEYTKFQELKLGSSKRLADMIGLFKDINYTDSGGERRKFGLEQVIMAATNDGFYKNKEGVDAIALADAELANYRRGIFLPDDINNNANFVKMLTDKGVPLSIFSELAEINRTYYDRGNEGLVKMAEGGSITDMLPTVNVVAPPIARGSFKLPSLEDLREKELAMGRGAKETEVEPTVTPVEIAPVLPNVIPEVEDRSRTAPLPPEKPPIPVSNKFNNFARAVAKAENNPLLKLLDSDPTKKLKDIDFGKSITATGKSDEIERGFGQTAKTLKEIQAIIGPEATVQDAYDQLQDRLRSKIDDISKTKNHRFKNIKNYPEEYQYILVSIADNIGIKALNKYKELQKAMDSKDNNKIKKEMVTVSSKEPKKYNKGLKNRANAIYDTLFPTEGNK